MYPGGRGNAEARRYSRFWIRVIESGLLPRRWVVLEVPGRRSGRPTRFPLGMADFDGQWFLVSMLGENCNRVRNARAARGQVLIRRRHARHCLLEEVPVADRPPILRRYLQKVPGARPHIQVPPDADRYPVFRVTGP